MTHEELIKEIKQLPIHERIAVRDAISRSLQEDKPFELRALMINREGNSPLL